MIRGVDVMSVSNHCILILGLDKALLELRARPIKESEDCSSGDCSPTELSAHRDSNNGATIDWSSFGGE